VANYRKSFL